MRRRIVSGVMRGADRQFPKRLRSPTAAAPVLAEAPLLLVHADRAKAFVTGAMRPNMAENLLVRPDGNL